jgi:tight adherence protein B
VRRVAALLVLAAAIAVAAQPATALAAGPGLAEAAGSRFPDRAYALTLPRSIAVRPDQVEVRENGRIVPNVTVRAPGQVRPDRFGVVLAIDTSWSMRGRPLRGAIAAARAFLDHRNLRQPVALVTFGGEVSVVQPFTTDAAALDRALSAVRLSGGGSRVLDAGAEAISLIRAAHVPLGSVVLLTDGADRGSRTSQEALGSAAKAAGARVFTVGLRSANADFGALNLLAATTAGEFSTATSVQDLARVYRRLGSVLSNQYVVQYRSAAGPHATVRVEVRVAGLDGVARARYDTPALDRAVRAPFHRAPSDRFWASHAAPLAASIVVAALLVLAIWVLLRPRRGSLRDRLAAYVSTASSSAEGRPATLTRRRVLAGATRSLNRRAWWASLEEKFDAGRIPIPPERALTWTGAATLLTLLAATLVAGPLGIVPALFLPVAAHLLVERRVAKQRALFAEQLPDNLQVIASAMRAGHSFVGALQVVVEDAPEPTRAELKQVIADERLGVPLEEAFATVVRRMQSQDLEQVALVAALQRETGGNTAEVLDRVNETLRERMAVRRLVRTLTAQGRMSRWVLTGIPVVLLVLLTSVNPAYMHPLYSTAMGKALLIVAATMVITGSLVIKRIVNIKV